MKHDARFRSDEEQTRSEAVSGARAEQRAETEKTTTFDGPEALLRHDAAQTPVPPGVADRLRASLADQPARPASWWRRLLGR